MTASSLPEEELLVRLRGVPGAGTFEAHVTVAPLDSPAELGRFRAACAALGVKSVLIELPAGETPTQPMTSSYHKGALAAVAPQVAGVARGLRAAGFAVTRVKVEALIDNEGVPATDAEAALRPPSNYFEFHVKVTLPPGADLRPLRDRSDRHGAHLSRNAFRTEAGGASQRFLTLRAYGVGRARAEAAFDALLADLALGGYAASNRLREYSIFDSNVAIDAGWIDHPEDAGDDPADEEGS